MTDHRYRPSWFSRRRMEIASWLHAFARRVAGPPAPLQKPWPVDRDGRVRTGRDRPVVLRGKPKE
jgi:hypothetical protein